MSRQLSIEQVLAELKERIEHHRRQEALHAEQEAFHQKEKLRHAAELKEMLTRFETFQSAADAVSEIVVALQEKTGQNPADAEVDDSIPPGPGAVVSKLVARRVAAKTPTEPFGASVIAFEIQERYGARLKKRKIDVRTVAAKLRRMARDGEIHQLREGRAFYEALYCRVPDGEGA